jgi:hypothetical protein
VKEPLFDRSAANKAAGTAFVVRVVLKDRAFLQAGKNLGNSNVILDHFLLSMERQPNRSLCRQSSYVVLDQSDLLYFQCYNLFAPI